MKSLKTFECKIYSGLKDTRTGKVTDIIEVEHILQEYCDKFGFCFSLTPTRFIYKNGNEDGCVVGIINYPRFPETEQSLKEKAIYIGNYLLDYLNQQKISIVCTDETIMLDVYERN